MSVFGVIDLLIPYQAVQALRGRTLFGVVALWALANFKSDVLFSRFDFVLGYPTTTRVAAGTAVILLGELLLVIVLSPQRGSGGLGAPLADSKLIWGLGFALVSATPRASGQ